MLSRSSSFSSSTNETRNENVKPTTNTVRHHESCQNLPQVSRSTRPMLSRPLNIDHSTQAQHDQVKKSTSNAILQPTQNLPSSTTTTNNPSETIKRSIVQDDLENLQERLNEILISGPTQPATQENETSLLPADQASTTEYFTPKISIEDHSKKKKLDEQTSDDDDDEFDRKNARSGLLLMICSRLALTNGPASASHPFFDVLSSTSYEKEVVKYLLSLESRFVGENDKLRAEKRQRETSQCLKPVSGMSIPTTNSTVVITPKVRCKLIDWIISVHDYHRLNAGEKRARCRC